MLSFTFIFIIFFEYNIHYSSTSYDILLYVLNRTLELDVFSGVSARDVREICLFRRVQLCAMNSWVSGQPIGRNLACGS